MKLSNQTTQLSKLHSKIAKKKLSGVTKLFMVTLMAGITLNGCKPEKSGTSPAPGTLKLNNITYNLATAITEYYGVIDSKHYHRLFLLTDSLQIIPTQNNYYTLQGKGYAIKLELNTTTQNISQRYNLSNTETITLSLISIDKSKGDNPTTEFTTGTVRIEVLSNGVLIEISAQNSQGQTIEANYQGQSYWFNLSNK